MDDDPDSTADLPAHEADASAALLRLWENLEIRHDPVSLVHRVLTLLERFGRMPPGRAARLLSVSDTSMSRLVAQMARGGLVTSTAASSDRRSRVLAMTQAGRLLLGELRAEHLETLMRHIPPGVIDSEAARDGLSAGDDTSARQPQKSCKDWPLP
ncbi:MULTISPECIES: MarR family transcriptional regulator [unclassified Streptomyces]|uniref:MarR family transcriptional regulator n=1 Tax=unclassified Streptomyces TaxID=2593676 RepID=UPI0033A9D45D